jgi:hypothetical protein
VFVVIQLVEEEPMLARSLMVLLATVVTAHAAEIPDTIPATKCRGH